MVHLIEKLKELQEGDVIYWKIRNCKDVKFKFLCNQDNIYVRITGNENNILTFDVYDNEIVINHGKIDLNDAETKIKILKDYDNLFL